MKIIAYLKTGCPWCIGVTEYFKEKGIEFEEKNVSENPALFEEMKQLSGQSKAPVVVIDGHMLADTDRDAVDAYLNGTN
jgi:glutaredoxin 3